MLTTTNRSLLNIGVLLLRLMVGLIFFVAGAGKVMGWFGGMGMSATIDAFQTTMHISAPLTYLSSFTEFIGGLLLVPGFLTRPAALALAINMMVATILIGPEHFFMGGAAYPCSLMVSCIMILLAGPMSFSIDTWVEKRSNRNASIQGNFDHAGHKAFQP
jgi:putative oxidoreductase